MVVLLIAALLFGILYVTVLKDHFTVDTDETTTVTLSADVKVVEVPDLVGKYYAAIEHSPRYSSFTFTEVEQYSDEASGKIIAQNIDAGTRVSEGTNIELTISKGPEQITMPEVTGSTYEDASARLTALGFKVTRSDITNDGSEISGTVKSASLSAGTRHKKGTLVVLQVWEEPATVTTESTTTADSRPDRAARAARASATSLPRPPRAGPSRSSTMAISSISISRAVRCPLRSRTRSLPGARPRGSRPSRRYTVGLSATPPW